MSFFETAKGSNFAVKSNRCSKFPLNVQKLRFFVEKKDVFSRNFLIVLKSLKVANLLHNGIEKMKIFKTFKFSVFWWKIMVGFFEKKWFFFQKIAERSKLVVKRDWKSKTSQNVRNFGVFFKKKWMGFSEMKYTYFSKNW